MPDELELGADPEDELAIVPELEPVEPDVVPELELEGGTITGGPELEPELELTPELPEPVELPVTPELDPLDDVLVPELDEPDELELPLPF